MQVFGQDLNCFAQLRLEPVAQAIFEELCGRGADLEEKTGELGAEASAIRPVLPPLGTLSLQLSREARIVLIISNVEEVLYQEACERCQQEVSTGAFARHCIGTRETNHCTAWGGRSSVQP